MENLLLAMGPLLKIKLTKLVIRLFKIIKTIEYLHTTKLGCREGLQLAEVLVEIETGKGADALARRPQLAAALAKARQKRCAVVVSKLVPQPRRPFHLGPDGSPRTLPSGRAWAGRRPVRPAFVRCACREGTWDDSRRRARGVATIGRRVEAPAMASGFLKAESAAAARSGSEGACGGAGSFCAISRLCPRAGAR